MNFYVPEGLLKEVICSNCKKYLSVFPVYIARDVGETRCGRCPVPDKKDGFVHDEIFETFMEGLMFPCVNHEKGCKIDMKPADVPEHEQYCEYATMSCISPLCNWMECKKMLIEHINSDHKDMFLNSVNIELTFFESSEEIQFLYYNSELFLIHRAFEFRTNELKISVKHIKIGKKSASYKYLYYLKFNAGPKNYKSEKKSTVMEDNWVVKNVDDLKKELNNPKAVWVHINIGNIEDFESDTKGNTIVDWDFLTELECEICNSVFKPPIRLCEQGHSVCESCHQHIENACPFCRKPMTNIRNYALENLINKLSFRCKFYIYGCEHNAKSSDIQDHVNSCKHHPSNCSQLHLK